VFRVRCPQVPLRSLDANLGSLFLRVYKSVLGSARLQPCRQGLTKDGL
jgi:hypothetical protein